MPGNATPQFTKDGLATVQRAVVTAANTKSDGSGTIATDLFVVVTADATNGTFIEAVRWFPTASAAGTAMAATIGRLFLCATNSGATTSANCQCIAEVTLPAVTGANSGAPNMPIDIPLNIRLPPGAAILASNHAAPNASTAWVAQPWGAGNY